MFKNVTSSFSAVAGSFFTGQSSKNNEEVSLIRKADLENHNKDGGFWTVIDGKVYDIKDFQAQSQSLTGNSILGRFICRGDYRLMPDLIAVLSLA